MKNDARLGIRCNEDWLDKIKEKAANNGETLTQYITTCIALGECVREGIIIEEDKENEILCDSEGKT